MKVHIVQSYAQGPVASNYSHHEFLAEAHKRFPQPSPFLTEFLKRYEALAELEVAVERVQSEESQAQTIDCPACGMAITIEVEREDLI